ncbi:MAG: tetratricopeptide repeat protein [Planctomycetes bacterium]|nr:tetratricopeptide repeat protein [Planctomycetota bacterium]
MKQATAHYNDREAEQAIAMLHRAVELTELVPDEDPLVRRQAYQAYYNLVDYYFETDRPDNAKPYCDKAIELSKALQKTDPGESEWVRLTSFSHRLTGRVALAQEKWGDALEQFTAMLKVRESLVDLEPGVARRKQELGDAHTWIGEAARKDGQLDKALKHDAEACAIFASLMEADPGMFDYAIRLSNAELR